jgi:hypothetical protein
MQMANNEEQLLDILKEKKSYDTDKDKTFMLSLVLGLKKLNDDQKYWVKMEMLGFMRIAENMLVQLQYAGLQCFSTFASFYITPSTYQSHSQTHSQLQQHNLPTILQIKRSVNLPCLSNRKVPGLLLL